MSGPVPDSDDQYSKKREQEGKDPRHSIQTLRTASPHPANRARGSQDHRRLPSQSKRANPAARVRPQVAAQPAHSPARPTRREPPNFPLPSQQPEPHPSATSSGQVTPQDSSPILWIGLAAAPGSVYTMLSSPPPTPLPPASSDAPTTAAADDRVHSGLPAYKPYGAALAKILRVGDRVKRSGHWLLDGDTFEGMGTVTAIPSIMLTTEQDPWGLVDVLWDAGGEGSYRMGRHNHFDLELA